jgi:hypothetical protein
LQNPHQCLRIGSEIEPDANAALLAAIDVDDVIANAEADDHLTMGEFAHNSCADRDLDRQQRISFPSDLDNLVLVLYLTGNQFNIGASKDLVFDRQVRVLGIQIENFHRAVQTREFGAFFVESLKIRAGAKRFLPSWIILL